MASSTLVSIIIDEGLLLDSLPRVGGSLFYVLETAWSSVTEMLRDFARSPEFAAKMELAFGQDVNVSELQTAWAAGDFSKLPRIEVRSRSHLNGANGAYAAALDRIFISEEFLNQNAGNMGAASLTARVILEEIGHAVDGRLNESDSPGDEGAIFAALVLGESLDAKTLQALKTEDDTGVINLNGQIVAVEMQNFTGTNGNDNIIGTAGDDTISPLRGKDTVDGGEGNDLLIVDYSSNLYAGTATIPSGFSGSNAINLNGTGGWNGYFSAYTRNDGDYDIVYLSNIERFQIKGTNFNDTFDRGGYGVFNIDGGAGTDSIRYADFSSETTGLTVNNSGVTLTQANGNVVKNVEVFANLWTGTGNDTINYSVGLRNWENINTGAGNDTINTGSGRDAVDGGEGNDLLIVDYSSNLYAGTATIPSGMIVDVNTNVNPNGAGGWNGRYSAYTRNDGDYDTVAFSNIERFQIKGTNFNDTFDRGGYGVFNIDGGAGTDSIRYADFSSETTGLTVNNSGVTLTQANGNVVKNVEVFANLWTGTGNDTINYSVGLRNWENINTGAGNDTINTGSGRDTVDGGEGNDLLIVDYSSNLYEGTTTYPSGLTGETINPNGTGGWNGRFYAYTRNDGDHDVVNFSNIERFQIKGTNFNDTFDRGGYGVFNIDGGAGTDVIRYADFSSETTGLTVNNSGVTLTQANGNVVKNVEVFANLWTGTGNDTINYSVGLRNWENINTGAGNDTINTGSGRDTVDGGEGNDLLIVDYSSNLYEGTTTYPSGMIVDAYTNVNPNGAGGWNGRYSAYTRNDGDYDTVAFSNIERFQIKGTNFNDTFDRGGYGVFNIDGGAGTDVIRYADFSSETTGLTVNNSGVTLTQANGNVVKNVEVFTNLWTGTGNDTINYSVGLRNWENINTGAGNDTINTGSGRDTVDGGAGNDLLIVDYSSNLYAGTTTWPSGIGSSINPNGFGGWNGYFYAYNLSNGDYDQVNFTNIERFQITGTNFNDSINTGDGDDIITGGMGNDTLNVRNGNDILIGVDPNSSNPGRGEIDSFTGGLGRDRFILGDVTWLGYDDGDSTLAGNNDYAQISDFNPTDDIIQLRGTSSNYLLTVSGTDTQLYLDKPGSEPDELIAILQNRTGLSLTASYFNYFSALPNITLAVNPASVNEDGTPNLIYTFTRDGSLTNPLTVNYTIGGTATNGTDYGNIGTSVTFTSNSSTATVTVNPTADTVLENDETVDITLASGTGYTIGTTTAVTGTILNDDLPSITLAVNPLSVNEDGTTNLIYTFTRDGSLTNPLTVNYTIGGTATKGTDYANIGTSVTFAQNSAIATVTVDPKADATVESNETVALTLALGTGYKIGTTTAVTGTILNDDPAPATALSINDLTVIEGKDARAILTVSLSSLSSQPISVNYTTAPINATANSDYTHQTGTLTIAANSSIGTIFIPILNDNLNEVDEAFTVTLSNPINATLSADSVGEVIITDTWQSNITRTLPSGVENLRLIGNNTINGTGNAGNNVLTGNSANNTLAGLAGNDTYVFTANSPLGLDNISETTTGGIDTLDLSGTNNPIRLNLGSITNQTVVTGNLTLKLSAVNVIENSFGGSGNDRITGNSLSNALNGGAGNDTLSGGAGNDILTGNQADDILVGGVGNDGFNYLTGRAFMASDIGLDTLTDFTPNADKLSLSKTTFSALTSTVGNGFSQATNFAIVEDDALVETSAAFIVYSSNSGSLFYNQNGSALGLGTGAECAVLVGSPALTASDFTLVA